MAGAGNNGASPEDDGQDDPARAQRLAAGGGNALSARFNPEQSCLTCLVAAAILLISIIIWVIVYWRNADEFKVSRTNSRQSEGATYAIVHGEQFSERCT